MIPRKLILGHIKTAWGQYKFLLKLLIGLRFETETWGRRQNVFFCLDASNNMQHDLLRSPFHHSWFPLWQPEGELASGWNLSTILFLWRFLRWLCIFLYGRIKIFRWSGCSLLWILPKGLSATSLRFHILCRTFRHLASCQTYRGGKNRVAPRIFSRGGPEQKFS